MTSVLLVLLRPSTSASSAAAAISRRTAKTGLVLRRPSATTAGLMSTRCVLVQAAVSHTRRVQTTSSPSPSLLVRRLSSSAAVFTSSTKKNDADHGDGGSKDSAKSPNEEGQETNQEPQRADPPKSGKGDPPLYLGQESVRRYRLEEMSHTQSLPNTQKVREMERKLSNTPKESMTFYDRNFITVMRAMQDFLLTAEDLKDLRVTTRRSPNEADPPIKVYWRKDVEAKSKEVWSTLENMEAEKDLRLRKKENINSIMNRILNRRTKERRKLRDRAGRFSARPPISPSDHQGGHGLDSHSGRVVLAAVGINLANFVGKLGAWLVTGSHAMFSEAVHSAADTANQLILAYGIKESAKAADQSHPYGYSNMQYVSSLISGVGIFCIGSGLSVYHGVTGIMTETHAFESLPVAFTVLAFSFVSEAVTLGLALQSIRRSAASFGMSSVEFVLGGYDPCVNVVLLEDMAAVTGVVIAAGAMYLSVHTGSHLPDAVGSVIIGGLLGSVAAFMIHTNTAALVGRSIPEEKLTLINRELEGDIMVRQVHDVKGIDMGNGIIRYKAEVDIDGRELARYYLLQQNLPGLLDDVGRIRTEGELEVFLLKHGENIVDCLGEQVDRIELNLKIMHPEIKHVDLEVL